MCDRSLAKRIGLVASERGVVDGEMLPKPGWEMLRSPKGRGTSPPMLLLPSEYMATNYRHAQLRVACSGETDFERGSTAVKIVPSNSDDVTSRVPP